METIQDLLDSHINGNLTYVKNKFKRATAEKKKEFILLAFESLSKEDFKLFIKSIF
jgi:hypothetical protein